MKWISVDERLPEAEDDVLVSDGDDFYCVAYYADEDGWTPSSYMLEVGDCGVACLLEIRAKVTHWRPLPGLPEKH